MRKLLQIVYEVRSDGRVMASFPDESKAKREMRRLRKDGCNAKVYSKWIPQTKGAERKPKKEKRKAEPKPITKCTTGTKVNDWLIWKGLEPVEHDMTFQELYSSVIVDLRLPEEVLGECSGRKAELIRGMAEAMDHPAITVRYIESVIKQTEKRRRISEPSELWLRAMDWEVHPAAADELSRYWRTLNEPFFLGVYRSGRPCNPEMRDSDLSVQPTEHGLALCYRDIPDRKVYLVLKDIDWVGMNDRYLEIFGKDRDGKGMMVQLILSKPTNRLVHTEIRDGWYLLDRAVLLCLRISDRRLREEDVGRYDYYLDYMQVYPTFGGRYGKTTGTVGFKEGTELNEFLAQRFSAREVEYLPIEDPWGLTEAFNRNDGRYLEGFFRRYPQARAVSC